MKNIENLHKTKKTKKTNSDIVLANRAYIRNIFRYKYFHLADIFPRKIMFALTVCNIFKEI